MVVAEKTIDAVVTHQFDSANDALNINKSVEISGFGKFYFNQKKALTQYNKLLAIKKAYEKMLLDEKISDVKRNAVELKLQIIETSIKTLKPKIEIQYEKRYKQIDNANAISVVDQFKDIFAKDSIK
jgi:hypothetical protein